MKKILLTFGLLAAVTLARPVPADAHFSLSIGLPGFGVFVHPPYPPPVVYAPAYYPPPAYYGYGYGYGYRPAPVFYGRSRHGCHRGRYGRRHHWDAD